MWKTFDGSGVFQSTSGHHSNKGSLEGVKSPCFPATKHHSSQELKRKPLTYVTEARITLQIMRWTSIIDQILIKCTIIETNPGFLLLMTTNGWEVKEKNDLFHIQSIHYVKEYIFLLFLTPTLSRGHDSLRSMWIFSGCFAVFQDNFGNFPAS